MTELVAEQGGSATLAVRIPADVPAIVAGSLGVRVADLVRARATELGEHRLLRSAAETAPSTPDRIDVLLTGRPIAAVAAPPGPAADDRWLDAAVRSIAAVLHRRPSVLVDVGAVARAVVPTTPERWLLVEHVLAQVVDCGFSIDRVDLDRMAALVRTLPGAGGAELAERLIEDLGPGQVVVEPAVDTLRSVAEPRPDDLVHARERLFAETGLQFPDVRLVPGDAPPGTLRIRLNDVTLDRSLDPSAGWAEVVAALRTALLENASWFVRRALVRDALELLRGALPELVSIVTRCYPDALVSACLRELLRSGVGVRNLPRIIWLLVQVDPETGPDRVSIGEPLLLPAPARTGWVTSDPVTVAARIRSEAAEDPLASRVADSDVVRLTWEIERGLLDAGDATVLAAAERRVLDAVPVSHTPRQIVIRSVRALPLVRGVLRALPDPPRVVSEEELGLARLRPDGVRLRVQI
jgi:hypothetical protein